VAGRGWQEAEKVVVGGYLFFIFFRDIYDFFSFLEIDI
jgi:hypothetical protein